MKRNYLAPPPPPPAIRAAMAKVAERSVKNLPVFDFSSGNVGALPAELSLFTRFEVEVNRKLPESLVAIAESLKRGIIESFYPSPRGLGYSPTGGIPLTKKLVLEYFKSIHGVPLSENDLNRVIITAGGQQALAASLRSLKEGTSVLMPRWEYDAASGTVKTHGLREVRVNVRDDLSIDLSDVEIKATRDSVFYLSMPNNPTGYTNPSDLRSIIEVMIRNDGAVVWDAPYIFTVLRLNSGKAVYDEGFLKEKLNEFRNISSKYYDYMCILSSLSKTCLIAGLRFGMALSCPEWIENMNAIVGRENLSSPTASFIIGTVILEEFLKNPITHTWTCKVLADRLTILMEELNEYLIIPGNGVFGALYVLIKTPIDGDKFSAKILEEYGVVTVPGRAFYGEPVNAVRLSLVAAPWIEGDEKWVRNVRELKKALKST